MELSEREDSLDVSDTLMDNEEMNFNILNPDASNEELLSSNFSEKDKTLQNAGWADAMSKILKMNKPRKRKTLVLSRAKRDNELKKPKEEEEKLDFDIDGESKDIKPEIKQELISSKSDSIKKLKVRLYQE